MVDQEPAHLRSAGAPVARCLSGASESLDAGSKRRATRLTLVAMNSASLNFLLVRWSDIAAAGLPYLGKHPAARGYP